MVNLNIDEAELKKAITNAVMGSIVGELLTKQVKAALDPNDYRSPMQDAVKAAVRDILERLLRTEYAPQLEAAVRLAINEEVFKKIVDKATEQTMSIFKDRDRY